MLVKIDVNTGTATPIGSTGTEQLTAADVDPTTGIAYASHGGGGCCPLPGRTACVLSGDLMTGAITTLGCDPIYGGKDNFPGISFSSSGQMYAALLACNALQTDCSIHLVKVNKSTGAITSFATGPINDWPEGNGMEFGPGDVLYHHDNDNGLGTINLTTGLRTDIGFNMVGFPSSSYVYVTDMAFDDNSGRMYAAVNNGQRGPAYLGIVDLATGTVTAGPGLGGKISSIFFAGPITADPIPTVSEWGLILLFFLFLNIGAVWMYKREKQIGVV